MDIQVLASGSSGNCYCIGDGKTELLLDAGIPLLEIQAGIGYRLRDITAVLISHRHGDHTKAIPQLLRRGVVVYGPQDVAAIYPGVYLVEQLRWFEVGTLRITPFAAEHDVECCAYVIDSTETGERLVYITDSAYVKHRFPGVTHMMVEANYSDDILLRNVEAGVLDERRAKRIAKTHMSIKQTVALVSTADASKLQQVYLLHLSDDNSDAKAFKEAVQRRTGAEVYIA